MLAEVNFTSPVFWAVVLGWIITVVVHEFAHGLVGHLGGDYTVRERGGLSLNPLQYIDPLTSLLLPAVFLLMGGVPLPGGATYIRRDLLRGPLWDSAVAAAGPLSNFLIFLLLLIPLHPAIGWVDYSVPATQWHNAQLFVATLAVLQSIAVVLNLLPFPGLDGFGIARPWLPPAVQEMTAQPFVRLMSLIVVFAVVSRAPGFFQLITGLLRTTTRVAGFGSDALIDLLSAFGVVMYAR